MKLTTNKLLPKLKIIINRILKVCFVLSVCLISFLMCDDSTSNSNTSDDIVITPSEPTVMDTLKCYAQGGSGYYTYVWHLDDLKITEINDPFVLPKLTCVGDVWKCKVFDSHFTGILGEDEVIIK